MDLRNDGTIAVQFFRRRPVENGEGTAKKTMSWETTDETETVVLRRPVLDELFELWEAVDRLSSAPVEGSAETDGGADVPPLRLAVVNLRRNALWIRHAIYQLGTPKVYEADKKGELTLRQDLAEPAWFSSATAAGQMLRHWQEVPLAPGLSAVR